MNGKNRNGPETAEAPALRGSPLIELLIDVKLGKNRMPGHRGVKGRQHGYRSRLSGLDQRRIFVLGHGKESRLMIGWNAQQRSERCKMLSVSLRHFLRKGVEVRLGEHIHLLALDDHAVIGAPRGPGADAEGLAAEGSVRRGLQNLLQNVLLRIRAFPDHLPEAASG